MGQVNINFARLRRRLEQLASIGALATGGVTRLAYSAEDAAARRLVMSWIAEVGLSPRVDRLGSIYALTHERAPVIMTGSHIDTVRAAGALDGSYGVVAGLEAIQSILEQHPGKLHGALALAVFANEEGARFTPDLLGSRFFAGKIDEDAALHAQDKDGISLGEALTAHGPQGALEPAWLQPRKFIELHIEQGPVLEADGKSIGIVEGVNGSHWLEIIVTGQANHAGTTPMRLRKDAGMAAAEMMQAAEAAASAGDVAVATVGVVELGPGSLNIVPGRARFTLDLRDPDAARLTRATHNLTALFHAISRRRGVDVQIETLSAAAPVQFDDALTAQVEQLAVRRAGASHVMRLRSGASHDAQILAAGTTVAMIFVPSVAGISHNPREHTHDEHLHLGAQILCDALLNLALTPTDRP